jgi:hypothetical protein
MKNCFCAVAAAVLFGILSLAAQAQVELGIQISGGGQAQLSVTGTNGTSCQLQYTSNLSGTNIWIPLTNFTLASSPFLATDPTLPLQGGRFYRVRIIIPTNSFQVVSAIATNATSVVVSFNKTVDAASVNADGSQFILLGGSLSSLAATVSGSQVTLTTTPQTHNENYSVFVTASVKDVNGASIDSEHNQADFTGF